MKETKPHAGYSPNLVTERDVTDRAAVVRTFIGFSWEWEFHQAVWSVL